MLFFSCKNEDSSLAAIEKEETANFDWLLGDWERINEQDDLKTFEIWTKKNQAEYYGFGFTLKNEDTLCKETIKLVQINTGWNFEVAGKGESEPTIFGLTNIKEDSFNCENPENEFPKLISYYKDEDNLEAVISDGETEILFKFKRQNI